MNQLETFQLLHSVLFSYRHQLITLNPFHSSPLEHFSFHPFDERHHHLLYFPLQNGKLWKILSCAGAGAGVGCAGR